MSCLLRDRELLLPSTNKKNNSSSFYASLRAWIISNYEVLDGNFLNCSCVLRHALEEKENIDHQGEYTITSNIITKATNEIFLSQVSKCRLRRNKKRVWGYLNLARKSQQPSVGPLPVNDQEEWDILQSSIPSISERIGSKWRIIQNDEMLIFLHCENVRIDSQVAVCEVTLKKSKTSIQYHQRHVPEKRVEDIIKSLKASCTVVDRVVYLVQLMEKSYVCLGFEVDENQPELYNVPLKKCKVASITSSPSEDRGFSPDCEVLTNSGGKQCQTCLKAKKCITKKQNRHKERLANGGLSAKTNHRYMSREQLLQKLENEKKMRLHEKYTREKLQKEMVVMEEDDHNDLKIIMDQIEKFLKMLLFWEEQNFFLKTEAKSQYRWHPRY
ncbi:hypothetical protein QZH41_011298 [Actinostola sp. cb2023]|nr:hypothetical protein QZH41_011298 [Actinostola sp. cb2023]